MNTQTIQNLKREHEKHLKNEANKYHAPEPESELKSAIAGIVVVLLSLALSLLF